MAYDIELKELGERPIVGQRRTLAMEEVPAFFERIFGGLYRLLGEFAVPLIGEPLAIYHSFEEGEEGRFVDVEAALPLGGDPPGGTPGAMDGTPIVFRELEGGPAASTVHVGPYEGLPEAYRALGAWAREHGHRPTGVWYEVYLSDPDQEPEEQWRTEVYLPLES